MDKYHANKQIIALKLDNGASLLSISSSVKINYRYLKEIIKSE